MARFKEHNNEQNMLIPVSLKDQLIPSISSKVQSKGGRNF